MRLANTEREDVLSKQNDEDLSILFFMLSLQDPGTSPVGS